MSDKLVDAPPMLPQTCIVHGAKMDEILLKLAMMDAKLDRLDTTVHFGNGKPAMTTRLAELEQSTKAIWFAVGASIVAVIGSIVERLMHRGS